MSSVVLPVIQWHPIWPLEVLTIMDFKEEDGKTTLTISGNPINATPEEEQMYVIAKDGMRQGFKGTWDQLDAFLAKSKA